MARVAIENVSKEYGTVRAVDNVSFNVDNEELVVLVGPSGCGKTTLLRTIAGIETPDDGSIQVDGKKVTKPGADRGFVFQQDCLFPWRTVWQNTLFGLEINGKVSPETTARTKQLLQLVGLNGFETYYPSQLSGGMRQRVNLARALAINPEVLIMDEPFSALDAQTREVMQIELLRIWLDGRKTVLFITHQIDEAVFLADRVVVLGRRPGRIKEIVPIDLPRPRGLAIKRDPRFVAYVDRVWNLIENDVRDSVREDATVAS